MANAIDEIIQSLKSEKSSLPDNYSKVLNNKIREERRSKVNLSSKFYDRITKKGLLIFLSILLSISGVFAFYKFIIQTHTIKSIAVIPYTFPRNDSKLVDYAYSAMDEIITKLQEVKSLTVRHRVSSNQYLDNKKTLEELRDELKVNYLVEITIRKISNNLIIGVVLRETKGNKQLWGDQYEIDE